MTGIHVVPLFLEIASRDVRYITTRYNFIFNVHVHSTTHAKNIPYWFNSIYLFSGLPSAIFSHKSIIL